MLALQEIKSLVPAAFRTAEEGAATGASNKYQFMTTSDLIDIMANLGWYVVDGKQQKTKGDVTTAKHMLRFRNPDIQWNNGTVPEILVINSHNRTSPFTFHLAIFRFICGNGLVIADKTFNKYTVRHMYTSFEMVTKIITELTQKFPLLLERVQQFERTILTPEAQIELAQRALAVRHPEYLDTVTGQVRVDMINKAVDIQSILQTVRTEDEGANLWVVFNKVQEHVIKGGYVRQGNGKKPITARELTNIKMVQNVNTGIWQVASDYLFKG